jgi:hypothetical protein
MKPAVLGKSLAVVSRKNEIVRLPFETASLP